jgi:cell division septation protein DedD
MASGGKRGAGDRVLESRHVIGLFLLMLVFSGVFFTLGYVMGRNQYDGQVRAANDGIGRPDVVRNPKIDPTPKNTSEAPADGVGWDPTNSSSSDNTWNLYNKDKSSNAVPHLEPVHKSPVAPPASRAVSAKAPVQPAATPTRSSSEKSAANAPLIPNGAFLLQVAALKKQDDALALASSLQKQQFLATVQTPQKDKYYRVQVGPFKDQKSADAAKKGLESAGFKAFYVKH